MRGNSVNVQFIVTFRPTVLTEIPLCMLRVQSRPNDIFVTRRKPPIVYFNRVKKLLGDGLGKVAVHGAGACVNSERLGK